MNSLDISLEYYTNKGNEKAQNGREKNYYTLTTTFDAKQIETVKVNVLIKS